MRLSQTLTTHTMDEPNKNGLFWLSPEVATKHARQSPVDYNENRHTNTDAPSN